MKQQVSDIAKELNCDVNDIRAVMRDLDGEPPSTIFLPQKRKAWNVLCGDVGRGMSGTNQNGERNNKSGQFAIEASRVYKTLGKEDRELLEARAGESTRPATEKEAKKMWNELIGNFSSLSQVALDCFGAECCTLFSNASIMGKRVKKVPLITSSDLATEVVTKWQFMETFRSQVFVNRKEKQKLALGVSIVDESVSNGESSEQIPSNLAQSIDDTNEFTLPMDASCVDEMSFPDKTEFIRRSLLQIYNETSKRMGKKEYASVPWASIENRMKVGGDGLVPSKESWRQNLRFVRVSNMPAVAREFLISKLVENEFAFVWHTGAGAPQYDAL
ncbi:hypothetical protein BJV82DRAFT_630775 [Fennellomyces sp. T-0311]|nr:hypothetical protein BJV82DRAFT_630775 [Fennellomyces sp. T-0311]